MNSQKTTVEKAELRQLAEMLAVFQNLPQMERVAVQYYIKGRMDAVTGNIEIPVEFAQADGVKTNAVGA